MAPSLLHVTIFYATNVIASGWPHYDQWEYTPEQVHLSAGLSPDEMSFNWLTWDAPVIQV